MPRTTYIIRHYQFQTAIQKNSIPSIHFIETHQLNSIHPTLPRATQVIRRYQFPIRSVNSFSFHPIHTYRTIRAYASDYKISIHPTLPRVAQVIRRYQYPIRSLNSFSFHPIHTYRTIRAYSSDYKIPSILPYRGPRRLSAVTNSDPSSVSISMLSAICYAPPPPSLTNLTLEPASKKG